MGCLTLFMGLGVMVLSAQEVVDDGITERSVIRILNFSSQPSWNSPWRYSSVGRGTGSGFVIEGQRIMTNAHVVSWARQLRVWRYQDPQPYLAEVEYVGHDCDLAILKVRDPRFFEGLPALKFGGLPKVRSEVVTYGYPAGGDQISYTRGVVSRIDAGSYVHIANRLFLSVQTDAAINPGNSGGPVVQDGKVVGVAFQGISSLENTGFFIPPQVVNHFLVDIEDGNYDGFPDAGIRLVSLQNPAYREFLTMPSELDGVGARMDGFLPVDKTRELLQKDDVLVGVNGFEVGNDGTILFAGNRVQAGVAFDMVQSGESLALDVWRNGETIKISLPVKTYTKDRRQGNQYDVEPRYFVYGGLVFVPLSRDLLKTLGNNWSDDAGPEMIYQLFYAEDEEGKEARSEPVVLASVLSHQVNADMQIRGFRLVDEVNGVRINRLEDVIKAVWEQEGELEFDTFRFIGDAVEVMDRSKVQEANASILDEYKVPKDRRL